MTDTGARERAQRKIMYVCEGCANASPECCGHYDRTEVRVAPDGSWLCDDCYSGSAPANAPSWDSLPAAAEYAALPHLQGAEWQAIETAPERPVQVEFYYGRATMLDQDDAPVELPPYRDERRELGYWDGEGWHHCGTGHRVNEFGDDPPEFIPTHWRPLPAPPVAIIADERGTK